MERRQLRSASVARGWSLVAAIAAIAVGIGLLLVPFVTSLFPRTTAADRLTTAVRPAMTQAAIAAGSADLMSVQTAYGQLLTGLLPAAAAELHESPATLVSQLQATYPEIRAGMDNFDTAVANAQRILDILAANRARYEAADSLPVQGVPLTATPWAYLAVGALLVLLGLGILLRPRAGLAALLVVALALAVVPFALNVPGKLADTRTLVHNLRDTLSPEAAATARTQYSTFNTMLVAFNTKALPAFASQTQMTDAQLNAFLTEHAPLLAPGAPDVPRILAKFSGLTTALVAQVDNFSRTAKVPFRALAWLFVVPGVLLATLAGLALLADRRTARDEPAATN